MIAEQTRNNVAQPWPMPEPARQPRRRTKQQPKVSPRPSIAKRLISVGLVLLSFFVVSTIISRFMYIETLDNDLSALKKTLKVEKQNTSQLRAQLSVGISLDDIETRASEGLDMDTSNSLKRISIKLPVAEQSADATQDTTTQDQGVFDYLLGLLD